MGGFGRPRESGHCPSTEYYRTRTGANFGGICSNPNNCPTAGEKISHHAGMFDDHPLSMDTLCLGCNQSFVPTSVWFANCRVRVRNFDDENEEVFECRGSAMKNIQLDGDGNSKSIRVTALDEV